jgi:glycerol uptake facilitator-like aquaporin
MGSRLLAEFTGTGLLVAVIVGSGIAATHLVPPGPRLCRSQVAVR